MSFQNDILIVDSEISNLRLLTELLERNGYKVRPAETVKMAIDKALTQPPGLILMEVQMPDMGGYEACRRLMPEKELHTVQQPGQ